MHVQIVGFRLEGMGHEEYESLCDALAPTFAEVPGLVSKVWLANPEECRYGGVYLWTDRAAMDAFLQSELFSSIAGHSAFADLESRDHEVLTGPTRVTSPLLVSGPS